MASVVAKLSGLADMLWNPAKKYLEGYTVRSIVVYGEKGA